MKFSVTKFLAASGTIVICYPTAWCLGFSAVDVNQFHLGAWCHLQPWPYVTFTPPKNCMWHHWNSLNFLKFHMHTNASKHISKQIRGRQSHVLSLFIPTASRKLTKKPMGPSWFGSVHRESACGLKCSGFKSGQGHMPEL